MISILSNPDASENISKLAGTLFTEQISAEQAAADRGFKRELQETRLSAAAEENRANRNLKERENRLNRQLQESLAAGKNDVAIKIAEEQNKVRRQISENELKAKPHVEALDKNGNLVFVSQAEISADPTLTPVPDNGSPAQEVAAIMKKMRLFGEKSLTEAENKIYGDYFEKRRSDLERILGALGQSGQRGWSAVPVPGGQGSK